MRSWNRVGRGASGGSFNMKRRDFRASFRTGTRWLSRYGGAEHARPNTELESGVISERSCALVSSSTSSDIAGIPSRGLPMIPHAMHGDEDMQ